MQETQTTWERTACEGQRKLQAAAVEEIWNMNYATYKQA